MTWEFSTDPEFEEQLAWMNTFVREEIWPLETLDLSWSQLMTALEPLRQQVKDRGTVGCPSSPEPRRAGVRAGQAWADARDPRHEHAARAADFRKRGTRLRQLGDPRTRRYS